MLRLNCFIQVSDENRTEVLAAATRLTLASREQKGVSLTIYLRAPHDVMY